MPSQASAVARGTVVTYRPLDFYGEYIFFTARPGKTNEYFATKLERRYDVGEIYKFGADRLRNGASTWW